MIRGTDNLFQVLDVPLARSAHGPVVIVSREIWRLDFDNARQIAGHYLDVGGQHVPVVGVITADAWPLGGPIDAWLLEDKTPIHSRGFVVGRVAGSAGAPIVLPRPARQFREFIGAFGPAMIACLFVAVTAMLRFGVSSGVWPWGFLLAKAVLLVLILYCCACLCISAGGPLEPIFLVVVSPGIAWAFRWAVADQRRRCQVCLRFLSTPVQLGQASQTFLGWYGTESMCTHGHGALLVPELATSCFCAQRWLNLEELCAKVPG
jgi:hypothetical protein